MTSAESINWLAIAQNLGAEWLHREFLTQKINTRLRRNNRVKFFEDFQIKKLKYRKPPSAHSNP